MSYSVFVCDYDDDDDDDHDDNGGDHDDDVDDHDLDKLLMKRILAFFLPGNLDVYRETLFAVRFWLRDLF
jgi:hypothetical protein